MNKSIGMVPQTGAKYRRLVFRITLDGPAFNKWDDVLRCGIFELSRN